MQAAKKSVRLQIVETLGGRCQWHGGCDVADPDILDIDHVYGGGNEERRNLGRALSAGQHRKQGIGTGTWTEPGYYQAILERVLTGSKNYQLLCANHHRKKYAIERRCKKWEGEQPCPFAVIDGVVVHAS